LSQPPLDDSDIFVIRFSLLATLICLQSKVASLVSTPSHHRSIK
jgi:hypothetical protein